MKIQLLIPAVIITLTANITIPAFAQPSPQTQIQKPELLDNANKAEKIKNIKRLLEVIGAKNMMEQILTQMLGYMKSQDPNIPTKFWDALAAEISTDDFVADFVNEYIPLYDRYFTNEEIKEMIAFYETPLGKKTVTLMPQINEDAMQIGIKYGREAAQRAIQKLKSQGDIP